MAIPEGIADQSACIIIHPGSKYLRIGCPSDSSPEVILHAIARNRKPHGAVYSDPFLVPHVKLDCEISHDLEECRLKISHILQSSLMSDGTRRFATPPQQISAFNKRIQPVTLKCESALPWENSQEEWIVGDKILALDPKSNYNIHFPIRCGELNLHEGPGGSLTAVLADLYAIWSYSITSLLKIPLKDLQFYRAVLIIPDIYNRDHVKNVTNLLLCELGFGGCFVLQDHVAATFGAGLGFACVVDIGDQKTSVSCVEDALSHPVTRLRLDYGGADITQVLYWLLKKCGFPCSLSPSDKLDAALLGKLKQDFCHLNLVATPGQRPKQFTIQMADELLVAPLSLFFHDLLKVTGSKSVTQQKPNTGDPEDPFDHTFLRETSRRREAVEAMEAVGDTEGGEEELVVEDQTSQGRQEVTDKVLSLDQAILTSIERCHQMEVITKPKDLDPGMTTWKGAALMTCLEGSNELWISRNDWVSHGVKILREKCPFVW